MGIDWTRGYSCRWRAFEVDPRTWADGAQVGRVDSARVERVRGGLLESGTVTLTAGAGEGFPERYVRLVLAAEQDGAVERVEVATFLCASSGGSAGRGSQELDVECRSVLYPASVRLLLAGTYAPAGCDGAAYAASLLRECCACPVEVAGSFTLDDHVVFDLGDSYLDAAWSVLGAGGFGMRVAGDGTVTVGRDPDAPALELGRARASLLVPGTDFELDYSQVPNAYLAEDMGVAARAVNDDPASPTSTVSRGYVHDVVDTSPKLVGGETLAEYAERRLAEESVAVASVTYEREWWPGVLPGSVVLGSLPGEMIEGELRVERQSLQMGRGILVTEEARREVRTWPV